MKNPTIEIRSALHTDVGEIHRLNEAATPHVNSVTENFFNHYLAAAPYFTVATVDGKIAGVLLGLDDSANYDSMNYRWFQERYTNFIYVDRIYVAEFARRLGIARKLYEDFELFGHRVKADLIACEVNVKPRNDASLRFHDSFGFEEVGQQDTEGGTKRVSLLIKPLN